MKKIIYISLGFLLSFSFLIYADEVTKSGITAAPFLSIDVGARAAGMGGAFVAVVDDVTAMYWNPAGMARMSPVTAKTDIRRPALPTDSPKASIKRGKTGGTLN